MKLSGRTLIGAALILCSSSSLIAQHSTAWQYPLYLGNNGYWHSRIPIEITNPENRSFDGEPVRLQTGKLPGQLNITGKEAGALRLTDSHGTGLLFRIISPDKEIINEGPVPENSEFILPVTVRSKGTETLYLYSDNVSAWPVGAVLEGDPAKASHRTRPVITIKKNALRLIIKPAESLELKEVADAKTWPAEKKWDVRIPVRIYNFSGREAGRLPVYVNMDQVFRRLRYQKCNTGMMHFETNPGRCASLSNALLFDSHVDPLTVKNVYAYFSSEKGGSDGEMHCRDWLNDPGNLCGQMMSDQKGTYIDSTWYLDIPVIPGKTYMFGSDISCAGLKEGVKLTLISFGTDGRPAGKPAYSNSSDTGDMMTFVSGIFHAPEKAVRVRMSLAPGTTEKVLLSGAIMMEVIEGYASNGLIEMREDVKQNGLIIWPVNSVVKVFREDLPPKEIPAAAITVARNETEPLQIAIRSSAGYSNLRIEVTSPVNTHGTKLTDITTFMEGYVPVDYPSNYYEKKVPYWYLKYPDEQAGSDGWSGFWPDPLLPARYFDLEPHRTQPFLIEVHIPAGTEGGIYAGSISILNGDTLVGEMPWKITVRDFALPDKTSFGALYDYRPMDDMPEPGSGQCRTAISPDSLRDMHMSFMARHRICSGEINPVPKVNYHDGVADIDFTEYDKAARRYFDDLKNPFAYLPVNIFYLFGWAFPPSEKFGEKPYPGEYPYTGADRSRLRPEYRKAYQAVLKTFWDHLKLKGWSDRYVLYLSDEPHEADTHNGGSSDIKIQMKALCDMIHEVDPAIPVYVSTWWYRPEWEGYINIWGLGFNGEGDYGHYVTADDMKLITGKGGRIWYTTDGNFCTETPYMALERLLPWFGYKFGAEAYEFWGVNWLTYNPFKYGWHSYIFESQAPGEESWKRYPNGDGYIIYPGKPVGESGLVGSLRLKQVREGAEDYEYLSLLGNLINTADQGNPALPGAREALKQAMELVNIPCSMGRYSTKILKNPDDIFLSREKVAESIENLSGK